jgi:hypothetical protein
MGARSGRTEIHKSASHAGRIVKQGSRIILDRDTPAHLYARNQITHVARGCSWIGGSGEITPAGVVTSKESKLRVSAASGSCVTGVGVLVGGGTGVGVLVGGGTGVGVLVGSSGVGVSVGPPRVAVGVGDKVAVGVSVGPVGVTVGVPVGIRVAVGVGKPGTHSLQFSKMVSLVRQFPRLRRNTVVPVTPAI